MALNVNYKFSTREDAFKALEASGRKKFFFDGEFSWYLREDVAEAVKAIVEESCPADEAGNRNWAGALADSVGKLRRVAGRYNPTRRWWAFQEAGYGNLYPRLTGVMEASNGMRDDIVVMATKPTTGGYTAVYYLDYLNDGRGWTLVNAVYKGKSLPFTAEQGAAVLSAMKAYDACEGVDADHAPEMLYALAAMAVGRGEPAPAEPREAQPPVQPLAEQPAQAPAPAGTFGAMLYAEFERAVSGMLVEQVMPAVRERVVAEFGSQAVEHHVVVVDGAGRKVEGVVHASFDSVLNCVANGIPAYLVGPCGSGKNVLAKQVADALDLDFYCMNSVTDEFKVTGYMDANGVYRDSEFYRAFTRGGLFFLDELDASSPDVLVCLNMAIANRYFTFPSGKVQAHPDFRVVAAGNTFGTGADASYTGRYQLDAASLNRFAVIEVGYDARIDEAMAGGDADLLAFVRAFRKACDEAGMECPCSYRNVKMLSQTSQFMRRDAAVKACLTKALNADDISSLCDAPAMRSLGGEWKGALCSLKS